MQVCSTYTLRLVLCWVVAICAWKAACDESPPRYVDQVACQSALAQAALELPARNDTSSSSLAAREALLEARLDAILQDASGPCRLQEQDAPGTGDVHLSSKQLAVAIAVPVGVLLLLLAAALALAYAAMKRVSKAYERAEQARTMALEACGHKAASDRPSNSSTSAWRKQSCFRQLLSLLGFFRGRDVGSGYKRASIDCAPGTGLDTTLLLSDVQNSTSLWEMLPAEVMDACMTLHDECFRRTLPKFAGYESGSEGDAFVCAFHTPASALRFAMEVQATLLDTLWPDQLLMNPDGRPVYVQLDASGSRSANSKSRTTFALPPGSAGDTPKQGARTMRGIAESMLAGGRGWVSRPSFALGEPQLSQITTAANSVSGVDDIAEEFDSPIQHQHSATTAGASQELDVVAQPATGNLPPLEATTWGKQLGVVFPRVRERASFQSGSCIVIFRGLRVRMGIHTGIDNKEDVVFDPSTGRTVYSGQAMDMARAVADAAPGGGVLLSIDAFSRLPHSLLDTPTEVDKLINGSTSGRYSLDGKTAPEVKKLSHTDPIRALLVYHGDYHLLKLKNSNTGVPMSLFLATPSQVPGRMAWLPSPRNVTQVALGTTSAPVGTVTIAFLHVVGAAELLTTLQAEARAALNQLQLICIHELTMHQGYPVEVADGLILAAFQHPAQAAAWAVRCNQKLMEQMWSPTLTAQKVCQCEPRRPAAWAQPHSVVSAYQAAKEAAAQEAALNLANSSGLFTQTRPDLGTANSHSLTLLKLAYMSQSPPTARLPQAQHSSGAENSQAPRGTWNGAATNTSPPSPPLAPMPPPPIPPPAAPRSAPLPEAPPAGLQHAHVQNHSNLHPQEHLGHQSHSSLVQQSDTPATSLLESQELSSQQRQALHSWVEHGDATMLSGELTQSVSARASRSTLHVESGPLVSPRASGTLSGGSFSGTVSSAAPAAHNQIRSFMGRLGRRVSLKFTHGPSSAKHEDHGEHGPPARVSSMLSGSMPDEGGAAHDVPLSPVGRNMSGMGLMRTPSVTGTDSGSMIDADALRALRKPLDGVPVYEKPRAKRRERAGAASTAHEGSIDGAPAPRRSSACERRSCSISSSVAGSLKPDAPVGTAAQRRPSIVQHFALAIRDKLRAPHPNNSMSGSLRQDPESQQTLADAQAQLDAQLEGQAAAAARALAHDAAVTEARAQGYCLPGLFLKVGIDTGRVVASLNVQSGRIHYRGKVMNRAARVAARSVEGQVLLTAQAWSHASAHELTASCYLRGDQLGPVEMKGVPGLVELVHCYAHQQGAIGRAGRALEAVSAAGSPSWADRSGKQDFLTRTVPDLQQLQQCTLSQRPSMPASSLTPPHPTKPRAQTMHQVIDYLTPSGPTPARVSIEMGPPQYLLSNASQLGPMDFSLNNDLMSTQQLLTSAAGLVTAGDASVNASPTARGAYGQLRPDLMSSFISSQPGSGSTGRLHTVLQNGYRPSTPTQVPSTVADAAAKAAEAAGGPRAEAPPGPLGSKPNPWLAVPYESCLSSTSHMGTSPDTGTAQGVGVPQDCATSQGMGMPQTIGAARPAVLLSSMPGSAHLSREHDCTASPQGFSCAAMPASLWDTCPNEITPLPPHVATGRASLDSGARQHNKGQQLLLQSMPGTGISIQADWPTPHAGDTNMLPIPPLLGFGSRSSMTAPGYTLLEDANASTSAPSNIPVAKTPAWVTRSQPMFSVPSPHVPSIPGMASTHQLRATEHQVLAAMASEGGGSSSQQMSAMGEVVMATKRGVYRRDAQGALRFSVTPRFDT